MEKVAFQTHSLRHHPSQMSVNTDFLLSLSKGDWGLDNFRIADR